MSTIPVVVRWSGKKFDIDLDAASTGAAFKHQIYSLTNVSPDRQKVMVKGGLLKDDADMIKLGVKSGHTFMMMGTIGELPKAPEVKTVFMEDLSETELAKATKTPAGLTNLGNTCYANATVQCLGSIPELRKSLTSFTIGATSQTTPEGFPAVLGGLYRNLSTAGEALSPMLFITILRQLFPKFAERGHGGSFAQQDAEECWADIITLLKPRLLLEGDGSSKIIDRYLSGEVVTTMTCNENPKEDAIVTIDPFIKLDCHISKAVNFLHQGLEEGLTTQLEKNSPTLERSAHYTKTGKISRLPAYLTVHFVRFFWKQQEQVKSKILRSVKYPLDLDLFSFCTPDLQERMRSGREKYHSLMEGEKARKRAKLDEEAQAQAEGKRVEGVASEEEEEIPRLGDAVDPILQEDIGCNPTGIYTLGAVLTHGGREADAGHYIAWVRKGLSDVWLKYDDDRVSPTTTEEVLKMHGGGDGHVAYICLYKSKSAI